LRNRHVGHAISRRRAFRRTIDVRAGDRFSRAAIADAGADQCAHVSSVVRVPVPVRDAHFVGVLTHDPGMGRAPRTQRAFGAR
jgi:hypothetical protein